MFFPNLAFPRGADDGQRMASSVSEKKDSEYGSVGLTSPLYQWIWVGCTGPPQRRLGFGIWPATNVGGPHGRKL
jgi:hypothetical protein